MRIKELALATSVPADTIRHYERAGLLAAPARSDNNYRRYTEADVRRLRFIRNCRALDMSLDEVRALLDWTDAAQVATAHRPDCSAVDAIVSAHLAHVRERIAALRGLEKQLKLLREAHAHDAPGSHCGIVQALSAPDAQGKTPRAVGRGVHTN